MSKVWSDGFRRRKALPSRCLRRMGKGRFGNDGCIGPKGGGGGSLNFYRGELVRGG